MAFDDFDTQIQSDDLASLNHDHLCMNCGTDHGTLEDQEYCDMLADHEHRMFDDHMDGDFDSGMASAGFGTDEDYGYGDMGSDNDWDF